MLLFRRHGKYFQQLSDVILNQVNVQPLFLHFPLPILGAPQESSNDMCVNRKTQFQDSEINIYTMPCEHLICRSCTSSKAGGIDCRLCKKTFKTSELSRVHKRVKSASMMVV